MKEKKYQIEIWIYRKKQSARNSKYVVIYKTDFFFLLKKKLC